MAVNDGDIIKVVVNIEAPDLVVMQNVYYWQLDDSVPDSPSTAQILTALVTRLQAMYETVDAQIVDDYLFDDFSAERIEWNVDKWETVENLGEGLLDVAGESAGDAAPHGIAGVLTAQTARPQTRARKFIPGFAEGSMVDSTLNAAILTGLANFAIAWLTSQGVVGSAELVPVVVGQSGPSAGLIYFLISAGASAIAGYQRRRKPGVGM